MLTLVPLHNIDGEDYRFAEKLLVDSFPSDEYRSLDQWRSYVSAHPLFTLYLIMDDHMRAGIISIWHFTDFRYVEHFATDAALRGKGYGAEVLKSIIAADDKPVVLEVEMPDNEISRRRIAFYERSGFVILPGHYVQPPYKAGCSALPMLIMATQKQPGLFDAAVDTLRKDVYPTF